MLDYYLLRPGYPITAIRKIPRSLWIAESHGGSRTLTKARLQADTCSPSNLAVYHVQVEYSIRVQLLEIYNEQLRDLLDTSRAPKKLNIQNTERSGLNVPDAIQVWIASAIF